jgi:hypothetical protein
MLRRMVGLAAIAALAGCGDDRSAAPEADGGASPSGERASRFEVSVDTQRIATPDSEVPPSENAPD